MRYSKNAHCPPPDAKKKPPTDVSESVRPSGGHTDHDALAGTGTCELSDMMSVMHATTAAKESSEMAVMSP